MAPGTEDSTLHPKPSGSGEKPADDQPTVDVATAQGNQPTVDVAIVQDDQPTTDVPTVERPDADVAATPPAADADRWEEFATRSAETEAPRPTSRLGKIGYAMRRFCVHEWTVTSLISLALAAVMTWPTLKNPTRTIPQDIYDPLLQAWQVAWGGHALLTDPLHLWQGNAFYPLRDSYAFSDSLLGYAPLGMIGAGPEAALLTYNILYVLLHALAFFGAYALVRQLGARWPAAAVAGAAFAYAPWRLAQAGHMHVLSTGGIALALAMLARGHGWSLRDGYRRDRVKPAWAVAGWLTAAWQLTLGFAIGLPFTYVLLAIIGLVVLGWLTSLVRGRLLRIPIGLLVSDLVGGALFGAVCVAMGKPYLRVVAEHPQARRTEQELGWYSPPWQGFLTSPGESWLWGGAHEPIRSGFFSPPEMAVLPGMVLIGLAFIGLFLSIWTLWQRFLLVIGTAVTVILGMGPNFYGGEYGYLLLFRHLPGWEAIRTPGRLVIWTTLLLGVLAAGAVGRFVTRAHEAAAETAQIDERIPTRPAAPLRLAMLVPVLLILVEGINLTPHPVVPAEPAAMRDVAGPVLVLPTDQLNDQVVMLWSTDGFPKVANGGSGFTPDKQAEIRKHAESFPAPESVAYLREAGIRTVLVRRDAVAGTPWANVPAAPTDGLDMTRRDVGDVVVFSLDKP